MLALPLSDAEIIGRTKTEHEAIQRMESKTVHRD